MGKMKNYIMDLEEEVISAIENGYTSVEDVYAAVNTNMFASEQDVRAVLEQFHGAPEFPELNGMEHSA